MATCKSVSYRGSFRRGSCRVSDWGSLTRKLQNNTPTNQNLKSRTHTVSPYGVSANIAPALERSRSMALVLSSSSEAKNLARRENKMVSLPLKRVVGVAKRREGLKKQHSVLFFPERDRAAARPPTPTKFISYISFNFSHFDCDMAIILQ